MDLEGPRKFMINRTVRPLSRSLHVGDPMHGWSAGDLAAIKDEHEYMYGDLWLDCCTVKGKGVLAGEIEVTWEFYKDVQILPAEHLQKITIAECDRRMTRLTHGPDRAREILRAEAAKESEQTEKSSFAKYLESLQGNKKGSEEKERAPSAGSAPGGKRPGTTGGLQVIAGVDV
jgi:hypothetical protein